MAKSRYEELLNMAHSATGGKGAAFSQDEKGNTYVKEYTGNGTQQRQRTFTPAANTGNSAQTQQSEEKQSKFDELLNMAYEATGGKGAAFSHDDEGNAYVTMWEPGKQEETVEDDRTAAEKVIDRILGTDATQVTGGKTDWGKLIKGLFEQGANKANARAWEGVDFLAGGLAQELRTLGETTYNGIVDALNMIPGVNLDYIGGTTNAITDLKNAAVAQNEAVEKKYAANANTSRAAQIVNTLGTETVAAIPAAVEAIFLAPTAAANAATATTQGLNYFANLAQSGGLGGVSAMAAEGFKKLTSNPQFWTSYLDVVGDSYNSALEDGMSQDDATIYALVNSFINATIEIGGVDDDLGGIQNLPYKQARAAQKNGKMAVVDWFKDTVFSEGWEEVRQGAFERGLGKVAGNEVPWFSTDMNDTDAVINPWTAAQEFTGGAVVGALLGGGQTAVNAGINAGANAINSNRQAKAYQKVYGTSAQELVNEAKEINPESKLAEKIQKQIDSGKTVSGKDLQALVEENEKAAEAAEGAETSQSAAIKGAETQSGTQSEEQSESGETERTFIRQVIDELGVSDAAAQVLEDGYIPEVNNAQEYAYGVREAYKLGQMGLEYEDAKANAQFVNSLDEQQFRHAYELGAIERQSAAETEESEYYDSIEQVSAQYPSPADVEEIYRAHSDNPDTDINEFAEGFKTAYEMGKSGASRHALTSKTVPGLSETQRGAAYRLGKADAEAAAGKKTEANTRKAKRSGKDKWNAGTVKYDGQYQGKGTVKGEGVNMRDVVETLGLNDTQRTAYRAISSIAEATGINVVFYKSEANADGRFTATQGEFSRDNPGTIYIDLNAGLSSVKDVSDLAKYTMLRTFSHEFVHFIENWDAVKYNELRRVVFAEMEKNGVDVDTLIRSKVREGLDYDAASREAVAESLTEVLPQSSFAETLYNEHKSLYEQIADKLKQFIEDIKAYFAKVGHDARNVYSSAVMRQIDGVLQYSEDVLKIFDEAAKNAVENYQLTLETVINEPTVSSEQTVTETASEAESESKTESKTETKTEPQAETKAETQAETQDNESIRSENGFTVSRNPEYGSVEVSFDEKPSDKVRDVLKAKKFRWNGKKRVWYGKSVTAEEIRGLLDEAYASEKQTESTPVSEQAEPQGQTIIPTAKQSEMPQTEQQTESKAEEPVQQAEETVEEGAETVSESAEEAVEAQAEEESAAEIIEKAEEGKLREETPPKAETEEAKAEIKREIKNKGVKFPVETKNDEALEAALRRKELGIENVTLPGEVKGFNKEQRAYIVENLIEGYYRGEKKIKLDIPLDGKLTIDGGIYTVLFILKRMKATVTQEVEFSKGMLKVLNLAKTGDLFFLKDAAGQKYISNGVIVLHVSDSAYDYAGKNPKEIINSDTVFATIKSADVAEKIVSGNYRKVTEAPKEVKSKDGKKTYFIFKTDDGTTFFDKDYVSYFDGYGVEFSIKSGKTLSGASWSMLKAVDENGNVIGVVNSIRASSLNENTITPSKLKAFAEKKKSAKAGKIERKNENESNKNENNKRGVLESDADGAGASRLLDELQDGDVQQSGEQRGSAADTSEQGRVASRDSSGESSDARSSGGEGSSKVNDIRRDGELTAEEKQTKDESLRETVKEQAERQSPESPKGRNFVIGQSLELPNGEKARFRANVDALKLVRKLETEGRNATPAEQEILSKYVGWGGLANAFGELKWNSTERKSVMTAKKGWESEFEELRGLVNDGTITEEEYKLMQGSTANAHYTSIEVIKAMYYGLEKLGFQGGRMLEPAAGVGNFIGAMPTGMSAKVKSWTAVELDSITGLITKHLYPNADVRIEGFEKANIPDGYMDVAISNVPFGKYGVTDRAYPNRMTKSIHNYFFAKALDKVRPGGIVMFITSSFTMNSADSSVREYIMKRADLLGAIRLPNTAFTGNAGTQVVTDILILKKREAGTEYAGEAFEKAPDINPVAGDWNHANINEYFINHPDMVLGTAAFVRGMYGPESLTYNPLTDKGTLGGQIKAAFGRIKGKMDYTPQKTPEKANFEAERANKKPKKGSLTVKDGKVYRNENGKTVEESANKDTAARVAGLIEIRDAYNELANAELQGLDEKTIKAARKKLNKLYDEFVKKYGYINNPKNAKVFANDPDSYSLLSLEKYQKPVKENKAAGIKAKKESAEKADIFTQSTIRSNRTVTHVDSVEEGLIVSINRKGEVDAEYIAELTGKTAEEVTKELVESRRAFKTKNGGLEAPDKYLSGNVRAKLREAEALAKFDKDFENNVEELKRVVPKDILPEDIFVQPGAQWIPDSVYADFIAETLGGRNLPNSYRGVDVEVSRTSTGEFKIQVNNSSLKSRAVNTQELGTPRRTFLNIMESLMLGRSITVFDKITDENGSERRVVNKEATAAAKEKAEKIQEKFCEWLWADKVRKDELAFLYNETFNALATPKYDGANMTVNGLKAGANLRPHQLNAVQRIISSGGNTLLAHRVGAGKTLEMAAAAMKLRELGIVKKPVFVVPKALVSQWGAEFKEFFPAARLIVADENSFTPGNRRIFANRIANNDFDACIMSYEQFEKIPLSKEEQARFYQQQIDEMLAAVAEAKAEKGGSLSVKAMVAKIKSLEKKLDSLNTKAKDTDNITFEGLGIDSLFVDEAQNFKNLMFSSHMQNVAGLGNSKGSQRAFDLYAKIRYLQRLNGGRGIVFATATPVMNSMTEMYTMQRYLQTDMLESLGLKTFDAWAKQFGEVVNRLEVSPSGTGFRIKATFSKFRNLNELQLLFRSFADVLTHVDGLKIPKMKGGAVKTVECELSEFQKSYIEELAKRSENIKNVDPRVDNMLKITSDGRKASYTQKMIDPSLPFEPGCKIYRCCDNVIKEYKESSGIKGTQIIFCDLGTPKKSRGKTAAAVDEDANVEEVLDNSSVDLYSEMKNRLVEMGIPANEIAFIHDADTNEKRLKLFEDVNEGRVRVLIGSTSKMGVGMNAQKRVVAIHHLDAPHRPGDIEQRDGRAFRQKNINDEVSKYVYITVGSYDTKLWDNLKRKAETIDQVMNGDDIGRSVEDTGEVTLSAAEIMALSSGSPLIMEQVQLTSELEELRLQKKSHNAAVATARKKAQEDAQRIPTLENAIAKAKTDIKNRVDTYSEGKYSMTVGKQKYTDKKEAGKALAIEILAKAKEGQFTKVGEFAGFELQVMKYDRAVAAAKGSEYAGQIVRAQSYPFEVKPFYLDSPTHLANEVTKKVEGIDAYLKSWQSALESTRADLAAQEKLSKAPFAKQAELDAKTKRFDEVMAILNPQDEQTLDDSENDTQYQERDYLDDEGTIQYDSSKSKRSSYSETETLFLQWSHGSAPVGEVKSFIRYGKRHFYEKTAEYCVELSLAQYNERKNIDGENTYARIQRQINGVADKNGYAKGNLYRSVDSDRNSGTAEVLSGYTVGEKLRNDAGRSISSVDRYGAGISEVDEEERAEGFKAEGVVQYSRRVTDADTLKFLNEQREKGEVVHTYKTFLELEVNGQKKLYPPMASMQRDENGKKQMANAMAVGEWEESIGNPNSKSIVIDVDSNKQPKINEETGNYKWKYKLEKSDVDSTVPAAFNPYQHSSDVVLNDQFTIAYKRPNLVTYECIIPESELTSGYRFSAARDSDGLIVEAKDAVGMHDWKKGPLAEQLKSTTRHTYLSRWLMPVRRLENSEVAQMYQNILEKEDGEIPVPFNVVSPGLQEELEKIGVPIDYEGSASYRDLRNRFGAEKYPVGKPIADTQYQQRSSPLTNREVLELAASGVGFEQLNEAEKNALEIFGKRLDNLAQLQEERVNLGREYMKQQFTKGGSRQEAAKTLNAMKVLDAKIKETENEVIGLENKEVLKKVLVKARTVVETKEKLQGQEALRRYRIKREESAAVRKYRTRVRNDVETLRKWLVSPSNKDIVKHVPAEIQKSVADFLSSINMMSKTALRTAGLETTKADDAYIKSMQKMRNAIKSNVNAQGLYSGYADLPEDFFEKFDALIAASEELMKNNSDGFVVNLMSASELKQLSITLRTLTAFIKNMNTLHSNAMFKHAADAGEATIAHLNHLSTSKMSGRAYNFMRFGYMRPSYAFEHFGEGGRSIEHEFREGQATQAHLAKRIIDFAKSTYTGKEVDAWSKEIKTFTLSTGETVSMPVTHLMSLYCLNKRKQALTHIYGDGIRVANFKDGNKTVLDDGHTVTFKQVEEMLKELTPRQIAVAEALQKFMSTEAAQWGNYVSMIRFDVEQFTEQNYFPINSDGRYLSATADESPNNAGLYALLNSGFTKELKENAGNRIILYNIFDVFANHTASMAQYRAFALPMLDALKWFNYKNESSSVRARLSSAFGAPLDERAGSGAKGYAEDFVINLLRAYNGTAPQGDPYDSFGTAALHRYNGAAIAFNARVIIQQPMAITRAAMILSPKKLAEGLKQSATHMKALAAEMEKYSGIAAWKSLGFYDTNISRGLTDLIKQNPSVLERVMDVGTAGAEQADRLTWAAMWYAAKSTVSRSKYETEEDYFKAVTELFEEVIYKTQVVDSILTKSEFLRAKGGLARQAGSFMSEPSATMSMLADAAFKYTDDLQRGYSREEAWRRNGKFIIKTAGVYAIGQVMLAAVQAIIDAWRDDDEYSDEWFENYFTKYLNAFKGNVVEELMLFGKIPYVSEIYEVVKGYLDSAGLFDNLGLDIYGNDVSSGLSMYLKYISKAFETVIDMISGESTNYTAYSVVYNLLRGVSNLTGIPVGTAWREVQDLWNNTVGFISPRLKLETYQTSLERTWREYVEPSGLSKAKYQALLEKADSVYGDGNGSYTQDEVGAALQAAIEDGTLTETQANAVWRSKWHKENNKTFDEWKSSSKKKSESASSGEATVTSAEYDVFKEGAPIYKSAAKEAAYSVWETQLQGVMSIEEYTELFSDADADGNGSVKQDEMGATLMAAWQNGKLSFEQCEAIWHSQWNSAKSKTFAKWLNG